MADNEYKTYVLNLAISKTKEGVKDIGKEYTDLIDDSYFEDYLTAMSDSDLSETIKRLIMYYPSRLKQCLLDMRPKFAMRFYDCDLPISINKPVADWGYIIELPSDYLHLIHQISQSSRKLIFDAEVMDFTSYAHVVTGTDDNAYYCSTAHTSTTDDKPITGANYASYWTLTEDYAGVDWVESKAYKSSQSGKLLLTDTISNDDSDSAFIQYIPYVLSGINDDPSKYNEGFLHALATGLAIDIELDFERKLELIKDYELLAKPFADKVNNISHYEKFPTKVTKARTNLQV